MKPLVSIIIPVYQVEKYLDKCIASVVGQTYTNLEIILIDDGSPDNCPAICDGWKERDSRITVIHQQNGGLSVARNEGLKLATGEFIGFVDSDDWIEPNMYELLLTALLETDADIVACNIKEEYETSKTNILNRGSSKRKFYSPEEALRMIIIEEGGIRTVVWNKLYRRSILINTTFTAGKTYEDNLWTAQIVGKAKLLVHTDYYLCHYLIRAESLSHNNKEMARRVHDKIEMCEKQLEYIREYYPSLLKISIAKLQNFCCRRYIEISLKYSQFDDTKEIRRYLYQHFCLYKPVIILDTDNIGKTIARLLFWLSPSLFTQAYILFSKFQLS